MFRSVNAESSQHRDSEPQTGKDCPVDHHPLPMVNPPFHPPLLPGINLPGLHRPRRQCRLPSALLSNKDCRTRIWNCSCRRCAISESHESFLPSRSVYRIQSEKLSLTNYLPTCITFLSKLLSTIYLSGFRPGRGEDFNVPWNCSKERHLNARRPCWNRKTSNSSNQ